MAVTPIQLATAYAALMNGGIVVQPACRARRSASGRSSTSPKAKVIDQHLSTQLIGLMNHVVTTVPFYKNRTLVQGYDVGGKTGTAQIWDPKANHGHGAWKVDLFNYSFVGYIGRQKGVPDLVVAVRIEEGDADRSSGSATSRCP